ncbi:MAG: DUF2284 domain-containing protein [Bacillota bacterium]|nr:DUF2284 domain-containing protein [Bacillota bacterium]
MTDYIAYAKECGISEAAAFNPQELPFDDAAILRQGCEANDCGKYDTNWSCPPGIGSIEEVESKVKQWRHGIVMQFLTEAIDSSLQPELFKEISGSFNVMARKVFDKVLEEHGDGYMLGRGGCTICKECTYPEKPCRYPEQMIPCISSHSINVYRLWDSTGFRRGNLSETDLYAIILY